MGLPTKRYVYRFELWHCPSGTRATFNIPSESRFEAEAILQKLLGEGSNSKPDYWTSYKDYAVLDTAFPRDTNVGEFNMCQCEEYKEIHFLSDVCVR